jgi:phosphatidylglycerophosphate synthase
VGTDVSTISESPSASSLGIAATYKSREFEGVLDLLFYRKVGFRLAQFFARLRFTPTTVTLIGGVFGIVAGHFYFYRALFLNLVGVALHVVANIFDNADGQLARLNNQQSRTGRILDPVVDHIIWLSIYVHLALRLQLQGFSGTIWILAVAAGLSHGAQAAAADYWRHAYLYFGKRRGELDSALTISQEYRRYSWRANAWLKILLGLYLNVTREQEFLLPGMTRLYKKVDRVPAERITDWFQSRYASLVRPTFKWWGLLMTNSRMLVLFVLFLIQQPAWFFWIEVTAGNLLLFALILQQQRISESLSELFTAQSECA